MPLFVFFRNFNIESPCRKQTRLFDEIWTIQKKQVSMYDGQCALPQLCNRLFTIIRYCDCEDSTLITEYSTDCSVEIGFAMTCRKRLGARIGLRAEREPQPTSEPIKNTKIQ